MIEIINDNNTGGPKIKKIIINILINFFQLTSKLFSNPFA